MPSVAEVYAAVASGQPRLEKIICHTNVPGDALFQRYNRCPWRINPAPASVSTAADAAASKSSSKSKTDKSAAAAATFSYEDHFDSTLTAEKTIVA